MKSSSLTVSIIASLLSNSSLSVNGKKSDLFSRTNDWSTKSLDLDERRLQEAANQRIVGGTVAPVGRYPYIVSLLQGNFPLCGGTLIDHEWVLSAAHCAGRATHIQIGHHDFDEIPGNAEKIAVSHEVKHPSYDRSTLNNDVLLLKLVRPSTFPVVRLYNKNEEISEGTYETVMGWGTTSYGGPVSKILREVEVRSVSNQNCAKAYGGSITDVMMCAAAAGKDACQGDSGGPLIIKGSDATSDLQVGIVSWGSGCADPKYPGVYATLAGQQEFIVETIGSRSLAPSPADTSRSLAPSLLPPSSDSSPLSWDISMEEASDGTNAEGKTIINVRYESSDRNYDVKVFASDCKESADDVFSMKDKGSNSKEEGFMQVDVTLTVNNQELLESSPLWNKDGTGFSFCLEKSLLTAKDETVVTRKYTVFEVTVDNQADFSIGGIAVEEEEVGEEGLSMTYTGTVKAFQCDENTYKPVEGTTVALGPFDILNVCVKVDKAEIGVIVSGITDLTISQDKSGISFLALKNGSTEENFQDLVDTKCNDVGICMARVQLINSFFLDVAQSLNVDGKVALGGGGGDGDRKLKSNLNSLRGGRNDEERKLQEGNKFGLTVGLAEPCKEGESAMNILRNIIRWP